MSKKIITRDQLPAGAQPLQPATAPVQIQPAQVQRPDSRVITLPDGRLVEMAQPTFAISRKVADMLADSKHQSIFVYAEEKALCQALCFVRSIDGSPVITPHDSISRDGLEQRLGFDGVNAIVDARMEYWPPLAGNQDLKKSGS